MGKRDINSEIIERLDRLERLIGADDELMDSTRAARLLGLSRSYLLKKTMRRNGILVGLLKLINP
jgi:hypothetical protein